MFRSRAETRGAEESAAPSTPRLGTAGKKCRLIANCFKLSLLPNHSIAHYICSISPAAKSHEEEKWIVEQIWPHLKKSLDIFVVRCPQHIFSPTTLAADLELSVPADRKRGFESHSISVKFHQKYSSEQVNAGVMGEAEVVAQHIVKSLASSMMYQKVGRRYFSYVDVMEGKQQLTVFSGFYAGLNFMNTYGPQMQVDMMYRALHKRTIIDSLANSMDSDVLALRDPEVMAEWKRRCIRATVVTLYNNRIYRIKDVHFDKTPRDQFKMYQREEKSFTDITYVEYYRSYYTREITQLNQPLLEAFGERDSERVFLVPELCALTGFNDEMRKDKNLMAEAFRQAKVSPPERLALMNDLVASFSKPQNAAASKTLENWKFALDKTPIEVEGRIFDPLEVSFGSKQYTIEEGNFQRWMRNGLQCPVQLDNWVFIYPETDVPVLDIWLRSLRDIAQVAFAMKMGEPERVTCSDQQNTIVEKLHQHVTPETQLVLLLTPHKDSKRVYQLFKQTMCLSRPCVTQVVKSETVRKRQSIAAVLSRIVLQMNAKFCGPLWHVALECPLTKPLFQGPTMVIGIDVCTNAEGMSYMGFAASLDTACSEYFSTAAPLTEEKPMSLRLQEALRDAVLDFARRNDSVLPEHLLVYRASCNPEDWAAVKATELEALRHVLSAIQTMNQRNEPYEPQLTFVAIAKRVNMRFFWPSPNHSNIKNPEPGTVVDSPVINRSGIPSFYLVNQAVGKGTASPTHYTVLFDSADISPNALQNVTYRLSFLYYNYTGSVKIPAPAQYARKIAHLIGHTVREAPHKRLQRTFFYL